MRVRLGVLSGVLLALSAASAAEAATLAPCKVAAKSRTCGQLTVPLDRSGATPGTVTLRVERSRARNAARPPLFVVAGAPGDSSTISYDAELTERVLGTEIRSRDVVVMDQRGTGRSSVLRCAALERAERDGRAAAAAECAQALGARRGFYTARDSAEDIEAVRVALGMPRIALLGQSYGARTVLEYARRHPANVERILLSSPVGPGGLDPLERSSFAALPRVLSSLCPKGACLGSTHDLAADTARLVQRLSSRPLRGPLIDGRGRSHSVTVGPEDVYALLGATGTIGLGGMSVFPGLVRNALRGDSAPLVRTLARADFFGALGYDPRASSPAAAAASVCEESTFPWSRTSPPADREGEALAFVTSLPASTFAPFGAATSLRGETLNLCRLWPVASPAPEPIASLPAIPALIVVSEQELRSPAEDAEAVARLIPGAQLLRDRSGIVGMPSLMIDDCAGRAARRFLAGGRPGACAPRHRSYLRVSKPPPMTLGEVPPAAVRGRAGRTFAAARLTFADGVTSVTFAFFERASEAWRDRLQGQAASDFLSRPMRAGGLRRGRVTLDFKSDRLRFSRVSYVPGVSVSGRISNFFKTSSPRTRGVLRVSGDSASRGRLTIRGDVMRGRLGGHRVRGKLQAPYASFDDKGEGAFFISPAALAAARMGQ